MVKTAEDTHSEDTQYQHSLLTGDGFVLASIMKGAPYICQGCSVCSFNQRCVSSDALRLLHFF